MQIKELRIFNVTSFNMNRCNGSDYSFNIVECKISSDTITIVSPFPLLYYTPATKSTGQYGYIIGHWSQVNIRQTEY
jgi:hypothetical protein